MDLRVERASSYDGKFSPHYLPFQIGCFSIDSEGKYRNDGHQLKFLSMPEDMNDVYMDLNEGFHEYIHVFEDNDSKYNGMLKWILAHQDLVRKHFVDRSSSPKIDFVIFRGLFTAISSTIYEDRKDWMMYATKCRSVIYLHDVKTERKINEDKMATEKEIRMTCWGFKFEQYMASDSVNSKPNTSVPVNENEKYYAVLKGKVGNHRMLLSAEMDAEDPEYSAASGSSSPLRYVELKTNRIITHEKQYWTFRKYKLLKWYLQTRFTGVPRVICGFRNDEGIVRNLEVFKVNEIPGLAQDLWSPTACFNFVSHFLDHVKQCVTEDGAVYKFYWNPGSRIISCEKLDQESAFLPEWYTSEVTVI